MQTTTPPLFAEPTPLGLLGLSIGCGALLPVAFGQATTPAALQTAAMFCLLFGGGGQLLAGLMALANKNALGGTLFTTFSFNWILNWWALSGMADGKFPDSHVIFAVDCTFLVIFLGLTYAMGFHSKLLFAFLLDIDLLYVARIVKDLTGAAALSQVIAWATVGLMVLALWLAFALLLNPAAGRVILPIPGPLYAPTAAEPAARPPGPHG